MYSLKKKKTWNGYEMLHNAMQTHTHTNLVSGRSIKNGDKWEENMNSGDKWGKYFCGGQGLQILTVPRNLGCLVTLVKNLEKSAWYQGPIKSRVSPGPDEHSGPLILNFHKNLNFFDELTYIVWTHISLLVDICTVQKFFISWRKTFFLQFLPLL